MICVNWYENVWCKVLKINSNKTENNMHGKENSLPEGKAGQLLR